MAYGPGAYLLSRCKKRFIFRGFEDEPKPVYVHVFIFFPLFAWQSASASSLGRRARGGAELFGPRGQGLTSGANGKTLFILVPHSHSFAFPRADGGVQLAGLPDGLSSPWAGEPGGGHGAGAKGHEGPLGLR